jgi:Raf kinase inhibitor-like YbhB/YbcL family protein
MGEFRLTSPAFGEGEAIPAHHSCDGENFSPPLAWSGAPDGAQALALIVDDPDAPSGNFTHWIAWGLDPADGGLAEGRAAPVEGENGFGNLGYAGPCPPPGHGRHRYVFRLLALDQEPDLPAGASRAALESALDGHVLATAELIGGYSR